MKHIALFHSVYGLRPAVIAAAELFRAAGHHVTTPDLYAEQLAQSIDEGFAISAGIGWATIMRRAHEALAGAAVELFTYPAVGHFFTDSGVSEFDPAAARLAWLRGLRFVDAL